MKKKLFIPIVIIAVSIIAITVSYFYIDINKVSIDAKITQESNGVAVYYIVNNNANHSISVEAKDIYTNDYEYLCQNGECVDVIEKGSTIKFGYFYECETESDFKRIIDNYKDSNIQFRIHYSSPTAISQRYKSITVPCEEA